MREIKFRGRSVDSDEWVYGNYLGKCDEDESYDCIESVTYIDGAPNFHVRYATFRETVGQYTGMNDASGKEIYEGDIAQWKEYDLHSGAGRTYRGRVEFHNGSFRIGSFLLYNLVGKRGFKIIGNIYENPELIEVAE